MKTYEKPLLGSGWKFVLTYGLSWAIIVMLLTTVFEFLMENDTLIFTPRSIAVRIGIWIVGGLVYGLCVRAWLWRRYKKIKSKAMA